MKLVRLTRYDDSALWVNPLTVTEITVTGRNPGATQINGFHVKETAEIAAMKINAELETLEGVNVEQWLRGKRQSAVDY